MVDSLILHQKGISFNIRFYDNEKKSYETGRDGKLHILYYDTYDRKYITEKEAIEIEKSSSTSAIKREEIKEEKKDVIIEGILWGIDEYNNIKVIFDFNENIKNFIINHRVLSH